MPTLHLIDTDSTQACPAVLCAIRTAMTESTDNNDRLVVLGKRSFADQAGQAGIVNVESITASFSRGWFGQLPLRRAMGGTPNGDPIRCWSIGALHAAAAVFKTHDIQLSLVHTPDAAGYKRLRRLTAKHPKRVHVTADNKVIAGRVRDAGVACEAVPIALDDADTAAMSPTQRAAIRTGWRVSGDHDKAVLLLSDHPRLVDGLSAAEVNLLGCTTLADDHGESVRVSLVMHPIQRHRERADALLAGQSTVLRVVQDAESDRPWRLAGACDAVLALGEDAGGLSLRYVADSGVTVIASKAGPAAALRDSHGNIHLAESDAVRDLAHRLHQVLHSCSMLK